MRSNGGVSSSTSCASRRTRCARTASMARSRAPRLRRPGEHRPRLRQRIDPALVVLRRPERRPVVEIRAAVPVAVPGELEHAGEPPRLVPIARRQIAAFAPLAERRELVQHDDEEPAEPHAFAAAAVADAVHAVVPVAGADERQPVRAVVHRAVDGADAVLEERRALGGHARAAL